MIIKHVDIHIGDIDVNLHEGLLVKKSQSSKSSSVEPPLPTTDKIPEPSVDPTATDKQSKNEKALAAICKNTTMFPEKVINLHIISGFNHYVYVFC